MKPYSIGIDIGGTKCSVVLGRTREAESLPDDPILDKDRFPTKAEMGPDYIIGNLCASLRGLLKAHSIRPDEIHAIGVSCGGPLDHVHGIIMNPPNLFGWDNIPLAKILEDQFHVPVLIQNDANACALAEWRFGAARGYKNIIFLTFGTGLGAGLILDGRLYTGTNDMAGEVGHIRLENQGPVGFGKAGSFEGFCSGGGIAQLAGFKVLERLQMGDKPSFCPDLSALNRLSAKDVAIAADRGDELAKEIYRLCGHYLGRGISILTDILNPEIIVIGSIYERSSHLLQDSMMDSFRQEALPISRNCCKIVPALLGDRIGDFAALSVALEI